MTKSRKTPEPAVAVEADTDVAVSACVEATIGNIDVPLFLGVPRLLLFAAVVAHLAPNYLTEHEVRRWLQSKDDNPDVDAKTKTVVRLANKVVEEYSRRCEVGIADLFLQRIETILQSVILSEEGRQIDPELHAAARSGKRATTQLARDLAMQLVRVVKADIPIIPGRPPASGYLDEYEKWYAHAERKGDPNPRQTATLRVQDLIARDEQRNIELTSTWDRIETEAGARGVVPSGSRRKAN